MDFSVQGQCTPHSYQRHLPGSARRSSAREKPQINPITGEEMCTTAVRMAHQAKEVKIANANGVPSLNLNYLKDDDHKTGAIEIDLNDYSLDTPNSASTVSWGTHRSAAAIRGAKSQMLRTSLSHRAVPRPEGVPELSFGKTKCGSASQQAKQPSAWDEAPVPGDLPQPSARYQQMYQQYSTDMKQSYREHVTTNQQGAKVRLYSGRLENEQAGETDENSLKPSDDTFEQSWTQKRGTEKQLLKKKDAEDLLEHNKRLKLIETVMVDQLSRAVISDPEQNEPPTSRITSSRKARGTNRYLHNSKITTRATATENLLSRRIRFGTRILTQNGQDALRELTGFFFDFDQTLTVYEFRQFGKSAKAMPFLYRGQYTHIDGPKQGLLYSLADIYTGADVKIQTEGQLTLTDSLAERSHITLRVTDVDESERRALLAERDGGDGRLQAPSKYEIDNRKYLRLIQDEVQKQILKRGIRVITGLGRYYRKMDNYKSGILDQYDLETGLKTFHINLDMEQLEQVFDILDPEGSKLLDYQDYMRGVIGEMSEFRKALVRKAFLKMDNSKKGHIHVSDVKKFYNAYTKYKLSAEGGSQVNSLQAFLEAVREDEKQEYIQYLDFEEYYEGLSLGVNNDDSFANVLCNTWNI